MKKWILVLASTILLTNCSNESEINSKLSGIKLKQIKGESTIDYDFTKETNGKVVIVEFWETWCGPCIEGMHHLKELKNKFPDKLKIVCISSDDFNKTTKFIKKNSLPFDFIYDKEKKISKVFPHNGIPHSVLVDSEGKIQANTNPGFITENVINTLIAKKAINIPQNEYPKSNDTVKKINSLSLISFKLLTAKLGVLPAISKWDIENLPKQIVTGYSGNNVIDTTHTIHHIEFARHNILGLYKYAYDNIPESRIKFDVNLDYINSYAPNHLYELKFSVSSLMGNPKNILIGQLNSFFNLNTLIEEKDVEYYELVKVELKKDTIALRENGPFPETNGRIFSSYRDFNVSSYCSAEQIAKLIEDQLASLQDRNFQSQPESKIYYPVKTSLMKDYVLNVKIYDKDYSIENWLSLFRQNGLHLIKRKGKVNMVNLIKKTKASL